MRPPVYSIEEFADRKRVPAAALKLALLADPLRPKPSKTVVRRCFSGGLQREWRDPGYNLDELEAWFNKEVAFIQELAA